MAKYELDMTRGPLFRQIFLFGIPLILTGLFQLFYNAADIIVVGQFAGKEALAAVGATGAVSGLLVNLFMGLSVGTSVVVANSYGAGNYKRMQAAVHTSVTVAGVSGLILALVGCLLARPLLTVMATPDDVLDGAALYLLIIFIGMPANLVYNFGAAALRAVGDTRRPLYFLCISGVVNVLLNLLFVVVFHMNVAGVALATILSQVVSAVLVVRCLMASGGPLHLDLKSLGVDWEIFRELLRIGLPAGLQNSLFSISNVLIQSSINSFGSDAIAGGSAASTIEGFTGCINVAFHEAVITCAGQNLGAKQYKRMRKGFVACLVCCSLFDLIVGNLVYLCHEPLLRLFNSDPQVIEMGRIRMFYVVRLYILGALLDIPSGQMRGMGYSICPTVISLMGTVAFRIIWLATVFKAMPSLGTIYIVYPITWGFMALAHYISYVIVRRKLPKEDMPLQDAALNL